MIKFENEYVSGWEAAIRGMRNPYDSWAKSDSVLCPRSENFKDCTVDTAKCPRNGDDFKNDVFCIGKNDMDLMQKLVKAGDCHAKFARMIIVTADVTAPRYWWPEFDTYKVGTVANSCSTMHTIMDKTFELDDFSYDGLDTWGKVALKQSIENLNCARDMYLSTKKEDRRTYWDEVIKLLPQSYNQKRTIQVSYQSLRNMYTWRKNHKLTEWHTFCDWIEHLPYPELIIAKKTVKCPHCEAEIEVP